MSAAAMCREWGAHPPAFSFRPFAADGACKASSRISTPRSSSSLLLASRHATKTFPSCPGGAAGCATRLAISSRQAAISALRFMSFSPVLPSWSVVARNCCV